MSTLDPDSVPADFSWVPPAILAVAGQADPLITGPVSPNVDSRLTATEVNTADLQQRVADLETS